MPWTIRRGASTCRADQWAVVNADTGALRGCHDTQNSAQAQIAVLNRVAESNQSEHGGVMHLRETTATSLSEAAVDQGGNVLLRLIAPGWSKNGRYYSEDVLKSSALKAFREGTQTYLDHPSRSDEIDRPERSVRDLVGALKENAYYDPRGPEGPGLYARASVRQEYRPLVDELAESIGMSIRADGTGHHGEADGRQGMIIDTIESADSVDYVTSPAAGGKVIQLLESVQNPEREIETPEVTATPDASRYVEAMRKAAEAIREAGHADIADELQAAYEQQSDSTATQVTESDTSGSAETTADSESTATDTGETPPTETTPAAPEAGTDADPSAPTPVQESTQEGDMTGTPGAGTAPNQNPRSLMEAEIANMRRENAELRARERARSVVGTVLSEGWLVPSQIANLTESLLTDIPLTDQLALDEAELIKRATKAREREEKVGFEVSEALGVGRPRDLGQTAIVNDTGGYEMPNFETGLVESYRRLGMSEHAAKIAAAGRA